MSTTNPSTKRRALVTGASGGLGRAIALRLARDGLHVIVHANSRLDAATALAGEIIAAGGSGEAIAFDITDRTATHAACARLLESGPVQVLVNNAGTHDDAAFPALREAQWQGVIDVSVNGFFNVTQPLTMPMIRTRWGRIVNLSSVAALTGNRGQVNESARARIGEPRHHRQRGCAGHHRFGHGRGLVRSGDDRPHRADEAGRPRRRGRRAGRVSRV
jgi:3-oxoacyl-[acyl-carrier protein] reductase